jgi:hypothetical protein
MSIQDELAELEAHEKFQRRFTMVDMSTVEEGDKLHLRDGGCLVVKNVNDKLCAMMVYLDKWCLDGQWCPETYPDNPFDIIRIEKKPAPKKWVTYHAAGDRRAKDFSAGLYTLDESRRLPGPHYYRITRYENNALPPTIEVI